MRSVLVTDGELRSSLAVVRSLGRAGYKCLVCSSSGRSLAGSSRYARGDRRVTDPASDSQAFAKDIAKVVEDEHIDMIVPMGEVSILALLAARDSITARIPFPPLEVFSAACNKAVVTNVAADIGIRVPRQIEIVSQHDRPEKSHIFPLVLKPHASVVTTGGLSRSKVGVSWVHDELELRRALASYPQGAFPILAQEVINGPGIGVFLLIHEGEAIARFAHRRIREKPPAGGVSVVSESEPLDPGLLDATCRLLKRFHWSGVAMVEYKLDEATKEPVLMEINGRFWGSLQLAIDAGVDFPRLLAALEFGDDIISASAYEHVRLRWFWGDVDNLIAQWRQPGAWAVRMRALREWIAAFGPAHRSEIFRWYDPWPVLRETTTWMSELRWS